MQTGQGAGTDSPVPLTTVLKLDYKRKEAIMYALIYDDHKEPGKRIHYGE